MTEPKRMSLDEVIKLAWSGTIQNTYGMTWDEFAAYLEAHDGEMPPIKGGPFAGLPACWPHLHCTHP